MRDYGRLHAINMSPRVGLMGSGSAWPVISQILMGRRNVSLHTSAASAQAFWKCNTSTRPQDRRDTE